MPQRTSKAAAARAEKKPKAKTLTWQGLKLKLPPELPEFVVFDVVEAEASGNSMMAMLRTLRSVLGPEQFMQVRYKLEELGDDADSGSLMDGIFDKYGMSAGN